MNSVQSFLVLFNRSLVDFIFKNLKDEILVLSFIPGGFVHYGF
jgi:hypothetical protein